MSKLNSVLNEKNVLNLKVKSKLDEESTKKIRKTLLFLADMDIKASKSYNIIVIKKDECENKMTKPTIMPLIKYNGSSEKVNKNETNFENESDLDQSELADSSDFENEEDEF